MDIQRFGIMPYLDVVCGDAYTRKLELTLFSGGAEWPVPEGVTAAVRYSRSDGHGGLYDTLPDGKAACAIDGNVVTAILAPQVLSAPGFAKVSVALIKDEMILGLFPVGINVRADPSMEATKGESYYNYPSIGAINEAIADLESRMEEMEQGGTGITNEEKKVILALFKNIAYTADMSTKIAELEALWSVSYKVAYSLTGAASSNDAAVVVEGGSYTTTLTAEGGYTLTGADVSVTMGGLDVTSDVYADGVITIESVTGPVVISVVAKEIPSYSVTNNLTGVTTDSAVTKVSEGGSYTANLTVEDGYVLSSLVITMGGVDITSEVYGEGYILIAEVTGDVVITAVAEEPVLIETRSTGGTSVTSVDSSGNTINISNYANCLVSKRTTQSESTINVVLKNATEAAITTSLYIGGIEGGNGATITLAKVTINKAVCVANNISIPAGGSVSYSGVVPAGYHMGVHCTDKNLTVECYGNLDIYEPVNEYELIAATPTAKWAQYSGDTVDDTALLATEAVKYMTSAPFDTDTTLRVTVCNSSESEVNIKSGNYEILFATYGNGTDAIGYNTKRMHINAWDVMLAAGCEAFDAEFTVPAGYYFATSIPASCLYVKKVS